MFATKKLKNFFDLIQNCERLTVCFADELAIFTDQISKLLCKC